MNKENKKRKLKKQEKRLLTIKNKLMVTRGDMGGEMGKTGEGD